MTQWILSSSLLIAAVLLIRTVGRDRLSARLRYALWGLVLLRLLIPGSIGESALSIRSWMPKEPQEITSALTAVRIPTHSGEGAEIPFGEYKEIVSAVPAVPTDEEQLQDTAEPAAPVVEDTAQTVAPAAPAVQRAEKTVNVPLLVWLTGMVLVGGVLLVTNLHFALRLRKSRVYAMTERVPVYVTEAVEVPCLFGVFRPAVYITPDVWEDTLSLRHVLAHELTHYRHRDHLWSLLRCVAVTLHWYNPLVWAAAILSQKDGELACDEGALRRLGGHERTAYARTLMGLTCGNPRGMLTAATSMVGSESDLKQRVLRIVKNPKMTAAACAVALLLAAVIGVAAFTDKPDPLEGSWYGAREDYGSYYGGKVLITTQLVCRDGLLRITRYENGLFTWSALYAYEVKDDVLKMERLDGAYGEEYAFTWVGDNGIDFGNTNSGLWEGLFTKGDPKETALTDDPLMQVTALTDLTREGTWVVGSELGWAEGAVVDLLLYGEVLEECPMPEQLNYSDYCYGITAVEHGKTVELIFCDGWLYRDGVGYRLGDTDEALTRIEEDVRWEPLGGYTDELGNRYSHGVNVYSEPYITMTTHHGYYEDRFYHLEDERAWSRAWKEAEQHGVMGEYSHGDSAVRVCLVDQVLYVRTDGTITYSEWIANEEGGSESVSYYVRPADAPKLAELLKPYLEMAAYSAELGAKQTDISGTWVMESGPMPSVTQLQMGVYMGRGEAANQNTAGVTATVNGGIVEAGFCAYVQDNVLHIRWSDGSEEEIPCKVDGDTLTLYGDEGTWVLRRGQLASVDSADVDVIRIGGSPSSTVRLNTSEETLAELEALLRKGMVPGESNIIYSNEYFYKFIGLEDNFGATDVTLSDLGTLHFNGRCYELTNWDEVEAFLDTLYRRM